MLLNKVIVQSWFSLFYCILSQVSVCLRFFFFWNKTCKYEFCHCLCSFSPSPIRLSFLLVNDLELVTSGKWLVLDYRPETDVSFLLNCHCVSVFGGLFSQYHFHFGAVYMLRNSGKSPADSVWGKNFSEFQERCCFGLLSKWANRSKKKALTL